MLHSILTPSILNALLSVIGIDQLPALETAITLDFDFSARRCLLAATSPSSTLSSNPFIPRVSLGARLETRRGLKSSVSDVERLSNWVSEVNPATAAASSVLGKLCRLLCAGVDSLYTPAVVAAHIARSAATLELPEELCTLIISFGSSLPQCGHKNLFDDKLTLTLDSAFFNRFLSPLRLIKTVLPLLSTLGHSLPLLSIPRIPLSLSTHFYRRELSPVPTPIPSSIPRTPVAAKPRSLKRKASTRVLTDFAIGSFVYEPTRYNGSASAALELLLRKLLTAYEHEPYHGLDDDEKNIPYALSQPYDSLRSLTTCGQPMEDPSHDTPRSAIPVLGTRPLGSHANDTISRPVGITFLYDQLTNGQPPPPPPALLLSLKNLQTSFTLFSPPSQEERKMPAPSASGWFSRNSSSKKNGGGTESSGTVTPDNTTMDSLSEGLESAQISEDESSLINENDIANQDPDSESGKLKTLLGILKKTLNVKDLTSVRVSLPAQLMEPIGNLELWTYIERPDFFAAIGSSDDEFERFLACLRWLLTRDLRTVKHPIAKPFNSILGEHFHSYNDTPLLTLDPTTNQPHPTAYIDNEPSQEILNNAGRGKGSTADAALRSSPTIASLSRPTPSNTARRTSAESSIASGGASVKSFKSTKSQASSSLPISNSNSSSTTSDGAASTKARVVFINEQTSHHPPVSHFVIESRGPQGLVRARGVDHISAKFTGANVRLAPGPRNRGIFVELPEREGEEYHVSHPIGAVAGLLRGQVYGTVLGETFVTARIPADSRETKRLRAIVNYHEESWLSKPRFAVSGIIYRSTQNEAEGEKEFFELETSGDKRYSKVKQVSKEDLVAEFEGNWRGEIKWRKTGETKWTTLIDLVPLKVFPKQVAPIETQDHLETRRVWSPVCEALYKKDWNNATKEKQRIEQEQRDKAELRKKNGEPYVSRYFEPEPEDLSQWDGRPKLTQAGREAIERDFVADYSS
ncbi:uncharacterized protein JCM6883_005991 [Sporobolomyces salmoneus]|uniref:uncharacterized protein n=1 Tax=Sporobolomyces salmoneus TaxID=183962 RepID=UPI003180F130